MLSCSRWRSQRVLCGPILIFQHVMVGSSRKTRKRGRLFTVNCAITGCCTMATLQTCWSIFSTRTKRNTQQSHQKLPSPLEPSRSVQRLITAVFQQLSPIAHSSSRWKALTDSVCFCIAKDMLPYDTVTDPGFRHMLHTFEPRYVSPDRKTIARHYMPLLYEREKAKVTSARPLGYSTSLSPSMDGAHGQTTAMLA